MKPNLSKTQRKALIFAHDLMRGRIEGSSFLPYVRGTTLPLSDGRVWHLRRHWIEPDRDPLRPYLSEDIFSTLVMGGCMEERLATPDHVWVYRITRDGCDAIGRVYPPTAESAENISDRMIRRRLIELNERAELSRRRGNAFIQRTANNSDGKSAKQSAFNYQARKR